MERVPLTLAAKPKKTEVSGPKTFQFCTSLDNIIPSFTQGKHDKHSSATYIEIQSAAYAVSGQQHWQFLPLILSSSLIPKVCNDGKRIFIMEDNYFSLENLTLL